MMDAITDCRRRLGLLQQLGKMDDLPVKDRREIHERRFWRAICLALLMLQRRLERAVDVSFDPVISRKLDAIQILLDE